MIIFKKIKLIRIILLLFLLIQPLSAEENKLDEVLEDIQRDIKTLEKAVYSESNSLNSTSSTTNKFDKTQKMF